MELFKIFGTIFLKDNDVNKKLDAVDRKGKSIANSFSKSMGKLGSSMSKAGASMTKAVTLPLVGLGALAVKTSADFEKAMSKVKAVTGSTGKDFDMMKKKAREMGAATSKTAAEAASAMEYMGLA